MSEPQIAFIGGGNMGRALIGGLIARGASATALSVADPSAEIISALAADFGVRVSTDNGAVMKSADVVVLAVKPQLMAAVVQPLCATLAARRPLVISIAAGVRLAALQRWCGAGVTVVRAMPNRPALCGAGIAGLYAPAGVTPLARAQAESVLAAAGETLWVEREDDLDVITAVSGSGPAYFFLLAEALAASAVRHGLDRRVAQRLAVATLYGAGQLAHASDGDLARRRAEVTSKGGTTEAALESFASAGFEQMVVAAVDAAIARGRELSEAT